MTTILKPITADEFTSRPIWPGHSELEERLNPREKAWEVIRLNAKAIDLERIYDALPGDRGGKEGPKGKAQQALHDARAAANEAAIKLCYEIADPDLFSGHRGKPSSLDKDEQLVLNSLTFASQAFVAMKDKTDEERQAFLLNLRPLYRLIAARPTMRQIDQPRPGFRA